MRDLFLGASGIPVRTAISLAATLVARVVGALGGLALSYWLAQVAGATGLGQFTFVQSIVGILLLVSRMGGEHTLLRLIAKLDEQGRGGAASRYFYAALGTTLPFAAAIAILAMAAANLGFLDASEVELLGILIWSLPPLVVLGLTSGFLRGHHMVGLGMLLDLGTVSGLTAAVACVADETRLSSVAIIFVGVSVLLALGSFAGALAMAHRRHRGSWGDAPPADAPSLSAYLLSGWPFAVIAVSMFASQAGSFALAGLTLDDHAIGLLRATERFAVLIGFALTAISPFVAPRVAAAYARSGIAGMQRVFRRGVLISVLAAVPVAIAVGIFGKRLLGTLGSEFVSAYPFLLILGVAQLIQACCGTSTTVLTMAGGEKAAMHISIATLVAASVMIPMLSSYYGGYGFAAAYLLLILAKEVSTLWQIRAFTHRQRRENTT